MKRPKFTAVRLNATTYPIEEVERQELARVGAELIGIEGQQSAEILSAAADCDALLVVSSSIPRDVVDGLRRCRVIARLGAGTDKIDVAAAARRGIVVTNVPDFCIHEQAEHTLALLLAFARQLPFMIDAMRRGNWMARSHPEVHRVAGQTLGLIGFGASAQAVAVRAAAFGLQITAWARNPDKYREPAARIGVTLRPLEEVLSSADWISLHLPLTAQTRGFLSAERFDRFQPHAVLINTARGGLVDEAALVERLRSRRIRGAALDVFEGINVFAEPGAATAHPLYDLDNVILTPHCAGSSVESSLDSKRRGARNAALVLAGQPPLHVVSLE
jgi:D-3-phosphoglycerate dehydrogenase